MKQLIIVACLCSFGICANGQVRLNGQETSEKAISGDKVIDKAFTRCYYLFSKKKEGAVDPYRTDTMVLDIGTKVSKFYDPARLVRDSLLSARMKNMDPSTIKGINVYKSEDSRDISNLPGTTVSNSYEGESYQIFKNKSTLQITVLDYTHAIGDRFKYEDEIGTLPWKITSQTDSILSYVCQKATLHFRGRDYTAWFTPDIPVNDGPWKFSGLPGLILKVQDDKGLFDFKLIGLEQPSRSFPVRLDDTKSIKCTRADFKKLKEKQGNGTQVNINAGYITIAEIPGKSVAAQMELE